MAMNKIRWKYYIIFIILNAIDFVIIAFFFPETKGLHNNSRTQCIITQNYMHAGLTLEEMAKLFGDEVDTQEVLAKKNPEKEELNDKHTLEHV